MNGLISGLICFILIQSVVFGQVESTKSDKTIYLKRHLWKNKMSVIKDGQEIPVKNVADYMADCPEAQAIIVDARAKAEKYQIALILTLAGTIVIASDGYENGDDVMFTSGVFGTMGTLFCAQIVGRYYRNEVDRAIHMYNMSVLHE